MTSPYSGLPRIAFWKSGVTERAPLDPGQLYSPKFQITRKTRIMTAGSCFAQHVGRTLREARFNVMDLEPVPAVIPDALAQQYGYRMYSARYGNIYTARQLRQLCEEIRGVTDPALPIWERGGRFFDAFRPNIEPDGMATAEEVMLHRRHHLTKVRTLLHRCELLVFTFGLTETWEHRETGTVYPTAPGTIAGQFDPEVFAFKNLSFTETLDDFLAVRKWLRRNRDVRFIITTSPVPLTATASGQHVEVATSYSKSVLRAVCGALAADCDDVDYFPFYEIITSPNNRGVYFEKNQRSVSPIGVRAAMDLFLSSHAPDDATPAPARGDSKPPGGRPRGNASIASEDDIVCEDVLLDAFAR